MPDLPLTSTAGIRWSFRNATSRTGWKPAAVPGCVHADLRADGTIPDPFFGANELDLQWMEDVDWEYRATFTVTAAMRAQQCIELCADGLDTVATVRLNGRVVGTTDNMFVAHRWDVKPLLKSGRNELLIRFDSARRYLDHHRTDFSPATEFSDPVGNAVRLRKQPCQFGWDWGPRFVTAGIWRDLRLEAHGGNRLVHVRFGQQHAPARRGRPGPVTLQFEPELLRTDDKVRYDVTIARQGATVARLTDADGPLSLALEKPELWWPAGQGEQPLYDVTVGAHDPDGTALGTVRKRLGLRTIGLDRQQDRWGESFRFVVNGRPIFFKGANWIPAHAFVATLDRAAYSRDLEAAVAANMNGVRVWGGGIYEAEDFYDRCDELGLLVWQDFMFACALYPGDAGFLESVRTEATQQVRRLHHRACLALWCGNNEIVQLNREALDEPAYREPYEAIFHELLPAVVEQEDAVTNYWPTSQWRGRYDNSEISTPSHAAGTERGDTHFWDVWHARHPVKAYEKYPFRFCSEFGMQSYSSPQTNATFCPSDDTNVFGPVMENHQKNRAGNQIILDYVSRRYRFPRDQDALIWLSQLNQAYCMQVAVEHYRRNMPRCMGAIYWQLNDCWPVASWSSIEFTGRWKLLHHAARRFYAPALVTAHVPGDESSIIGNYRRSDVDVVHLHTVYDAPEPTAGTLRWELLHLDGKCLESGQKDLRLLPGRAKRQQTLRLGAALQQHGRDHVVLRIALDCEGRLASQQAVFLAPPRFVRLPRTRARVTLRKVSAREVDLTAKSPAFLHAFAFAFGRLRFTAEDNGFDLFPDESRTVRVSFAESIVIKDVRKLLTHQSLVDTYT